jgi:hypothetical protein
MNNEQTIVAIFTEFESDTNWCHGRVGKYDFEAKLFDNCSGYGIYDGRVSKLSIWDEKIRREKSDFFAACIMNYDRGWDIEVSEENLPYFEAVMELLENAPKRFENE